MLKRFRPDDPVFLGQLEARLAAALRHAGNLEAGLLSVTLAVPEIPLEFMPAGLDEAFYWSRPSAGRSLLGLGVAAEIQADGVERWCLLKDAFAAWQARWQHEDVDATGLRPLALGGFGFAPQTGDADFPAAHLRVPALLLRREGDISALTFTFAAGAVALEPAMQRLRRLASAMAQPPCEKQGQVARREAGDGEDSAWLARVADAVADIQSGRLDKVVLTRSVRLSAAQPFDPARVMASLARRHQRCTLFGVAMPAGGMFMGASPELLAGLRNGETYCDALAGTAWDRGGAVARSLLGDMKNGREHRLVVQSIAEALRPVCARLEVPAAPVALHLGHLHHLWSGLRGRVKPGIGLLELLERLHPTPAVGGYPPRAALEWLAQHQESRSGWYTGAVGWMDAAGEGEFAVALRCAHVRGTQAELYAGAGIVAGSEPRNELAETEAKLLPMLHALGHCREEHD
ncbi:MAG: isochorismate synthase [Sulfuricella sp.]